MSRPRESPLPSWNDGLASVPYGGFIFLGQGWWPAACPSSRPGCIQIGAGVPSSLPPVVRGPTDPKSSPMSSRPTAKSFTPKQGQYLAFIYAYSRVLGRPPAEADMQQHFGVSALSVHQMVLTLERAGLVRRQPGPTLSPFSTDQNRCAKPLNPATWSAVCLVRRILRN